MIAVSVGNEDVRHAAGIDAGGCERGLKHAGAGTEIAACSGVEEQHAVAAFTSSGCRPSASLSVGRPFAVRSADTSSGFAADGEGLAVVGEFHAAVAQCEGRQRSDGEALHVRGSGAGQLRRCGRRLRRGLGDRCLLFRLAGSSRSARRVAAVAATNHVVRVERSIDIAFSWKRKQGSASMEEVGKRAMTGLAKHGPPTGNGEFYTGGGVALRELSVPIGIVRGKAGVTRPAASSLATCSAVRLHPTEPRYIP